MQEDWQPVSRQLVQQIRRMLVEGGFAPGDRLPAQRELAERLGASRATVREAVLKLESMGAIRVEPGRGTFIADGFESGPDIESGRFPARFSEIEVYQLRFALEGFGVRLAARHALAGDVARMERTNQAMLAALQAGNLQDAVERDFDFHLGLADIAGNRAIRDILLVYRPVIAESQRLPLKDRARLLEPVEEHRAIIRAVERRDAETAAVAMRHHIVQAAERMGIHFIAS